MGARKAAGPRLREGLNLMEYGLLEQLKGADSKTGLKRPSRRNQNPARVLGLKKVEEDDRGAEAATYMVSQDEGILGPTNPACENSLGDSASIEPTLKGCGEIKIFFFLSFKT